MTGHEGSLLGPATFGCEGVDDRPTEADRVAVEVDLGRPPRGAFRVVVRRISDRRPVVVENAPLLRDGTPMPTLHWLVGPELSARVGRLEAEGGVRSAEAEVGLERIDRLHAAHAADRERLMPADWNGHRPSGGIGGTRRGVKCLHAHLASWLAGVEDPVGEWVARRLLERNADRRDEDGR